MFMVIVSTLGGILKAVMVVLVIAACIKYLRQKGEEEGEPPFPWRRNEAPLSFVGTKHSSGWACSMRIGGER